MSKNRSLFSGVADRVQREERNEATTLPERSGPFSANLSGITNPRAPGQPEAVIRKTAIERHILLDPARCRPWVHHNRVYELLDEVRCADLIAGFRSVGRQQRPAIVRTLRAEARLGPDGQAHDFEIISGARRHWTVSWLQAHGETNAAGEPFLFLAVVRDDLDTLAAFELSDAENRGQQDISDYERAREYRWALDQLYAGNISRMAHAIQMDRSHLSRLLDLTEMPPDIVAAYPSILDIRVHHWRKLARFFSEAESSQAAERLLDCAHSISRSRTLGHPQVPETGAQTFEQLLSAALAKKREAPRSQVLTTIKAEATGKLALRVKRTSRGITVDLPHASGATKEEIYTALRQTVDEYFEP
ncbi:ParB/RepB/Spo0J family partition protein [Allochromatium palmeri]|uniref:ParB/RepB/Spo0J family partition protein n=1 Tax=Allochromatium palmeri TaxID=231048 RepID=A0A6N8EGV4_9GAMM|nr:ParB/RepB/Spo0J family partition protein [Allochromatium palmeri]MTW22308.1 ParB/RepB/Spo0J family partition protein [Allochromatium palmeri]